MRGTARNGGIGIGIGLAIGVAIGVALDQLALGIALGIVFGAGYDLQARRKQSPDGEDENRENLTISSGDRSERGSDDTSGGE